MTGTEAVRICFRNYATFSGRARRAEFWWFALFVLVLSVGTSMIDVALYGGPGQPIGLVNTLFHLAVLIPGLAVGARRLHDIGRSGWWQLLYFLPIVGAIVLLIGFVLRGNPGDNAFGQDPLASSG